MPTVQEAEHSLACTACDLHRVCWSLGKLSALGTVAQIAVSCLALQLAQFGHLILGQQLSHSCVVHRRRALRRRACEGNGVLGKLAGHVGLHAV